MKIECIKDRLLRAVSIAERISNRTLTLPILNCLLLTAKNNVLKIKATNLDLGVELTVPVKTEKDGVVAIPASVFYQFINNSKADKILLELSGEMFSIKTFMVSSFDEMSWRSVDC